MGVSPFGNPRIEAYLQIPVAYRSLSRPSSAPDAKAFTLCSCSLELFAKDLFFSCFVPFNCLSFFVHFSSCSKKALAFSPFLTFFVLFQLLLALPLSTRRNCNFLPYFVERPIFSQYYVLNICSFLLFLFYSVFNDHGFSRPFGRLVEMMGIEPMTPCLQGRCSPS